MTKTKTGNHTSHYRSGVVAATKHVRVRACATGAPPTISSGAEIDVVVAHGGRGGYDSTAVGDDAGGGSGSGE